MKLTPKYHAALFANESADFKKGDLIKEWDAPLELLATEVDDIMERCAIAVLNGCEEVAEEYLRQIESGEMEDVIYNYYIFQPSGAEEEQYEFSFNLSQLLEYFIYEMEEGR